MTQEDLENEEIKGTREIEWMYVFLFIAYEFA